MEFTGQGHASACLPQCRRAHGFVATLTSPVLSQHDRWGGAKARQRQKKTSVAFTLGGSRKWHHVAGAPTQEFPHTRPVGVARRGDDVPCVCVFRLNLGGRVWVGNRAGDLTGTHEDVQYFRNSLRNPFGSNHSVDNSVTVQIV